MSAPKDLKMNAIVLAEVIMEASTKWSAQENRNISIGPGDAVRIAERLLAKYEVTER